MQVIDFPKHAFEILPQKGKFVTEPWPGPAGFGPPVSDQMTPQKGVCPRHASSGVLHTGVRRDSRLFAVLPDRDSVGTPVPWRCSFLPYLTWLVGLI